MANSVVGIANSYNAAEEIVGRLQANGIQYNDVSVLMSDPSSAREFAVANKTKAPEGATAGASTGAVIGGALGWLTGIGALAIPGLGPFVAAGPIMAALSGAAIGGTVGGISGALIGLGMTEYEANFFEGRVKEGAALIAVHADDADERARVKRILEEAGAESVTMTTESSTGNRPR